MMHGAPPENLVRLLGRLKLATAEQVHGVSSHVRRLAGELPDIESVWVDGLAQARILTHLQASEINAGRGDELAHGPYVISHAVTAPHYADCFTARHIDTGRTVRLYLVRRMQVPAAAAARGLARLLDQLAPLRGSTDGMAEDAGLDGGMVWAACPAIVGPSAADWMVENGRFPPQAVLHIAREMVLHLVEIERVGLVHGDIGAMGVLLRGSGHVALPMPGLRAVVRPSEGYSFNDLQPEAYDYLAPERIGDGSPPTTASDLYACGCLWWHLLTGRPPFFGGNSLTRLKAAHTGKIPDVRRLTSDIPDTLLRAITICLARDPAERPQSFAKVGEILGPPARGGYSAVSRLMDRGAHFSHIIAARQPRRLANRTFVASAVAVMAVFVAIGLLTLWRARQTQHGPLGTSQDSIAQRPTLEKFAHNAIAADRVTAAPTASSPITLAAAALPIDKREPEDLVLPDDRPWRGAQLDLKPGQRVRGAVGRRPLVSVPEAGLSIAVENVRFEGIDFRWEQPASRRGSPLRSPAMVVLQAATIEFRGCSFSNIAESEPVAIACRGGNIAAPVGSTELTFADCVFSGVAALVDFQNFGNLEVEMANTLCVASGPIVRLHRWPKAAHSIAITLQRTTTRGEVSVLECRYDRPEPEPGQISIIANDSALDTNPRGGLLIFAGPTPPDELLKTIHWTGQGTLVTPQSAVALWRPGAKRQHVLPGRRT